MQFTEAQRGAAELLSDMRELLADEAGWTLHSDDGVRAAPTADRVAWCKTAGTFLRSKGSSQGGLPDVPSLWKATRI